jgi:hypothetical protein
MSNFLDELRNDHRDFDSGRLTDFFPETPFELFELWFNDAIKNHEKEPNALVLSTCELATLQPSSRVVYLKELVNNSRNAVIKLKEYVKIGEGILKTAELCRRLETEKEKVLPFYESSVDEAEIPEDLR